MHKINILILSILFFIFSINLSANEKRQLQIVSQSIDVTNEFIKAKGGVLVFSPNYYITAKKVVYNKIKQKLELFGNVNISKNNEAVSVSKYALIDLKNEIRIADPILLIDNKTDVWIDAKKIEEKKDLNIITNATLSSCDCYNPAWSLGFAHGDYNRTRQWVNTYNNTLYFKDIPAWYFLVPLIPYTSAPNLIISYLLVNPPYVGFSTANKRESGLLRANVGYSKSQGYLYEQPIFYAPALNYDFEFIPKIRSNRGYGNELKYRYKDSINSQLDISFGEFKEYDDYFKDEKLINQEHYGWNFDYKRTKLFSNDSTSDGLIISIQDMNDIEYKNTLYDQENIYADKIIKSKVEYFYNTNSYYADIHFEKYDNIFTQENNSIFQTRPKIQIHKYSNNIFYNISSSFDFKFHRKIRIEGIGANIGEFLIPIYYSKYFFDKYLNLSFIEQLHYKQLNYNNDNSYYKNAKHLSSNHIMTLSTDLLKPYNSFLHTLNFSVTLNKYSDLYQKNKLYGINNNDSNLSSFLNTKENEQLTLALNQSFYSKSKKYIVNHRFTQSYFKNNNTKHSDNLESELKLTLPNTSFINRTYYNHEDKMVIKSTFNFDYKNDDFFANIDYSYDKDKNLTTSSYVGVKANKSITSEVGAKIYKYYTIKYKNKYNISNGITKLREFGLNINRKCWELDLKLSDELIASATIDKKARRQNTIYATISLKPLISIRQKYIDDERDE